MATSEQLIEQTTRHQVFLERVKTGEANQFADFLRRMQERLSGRLSTDISGFTRKRAERLIARVEDDLAAIYDEYWQELRGNLIDIGEYEAEFEARSINEVMENFEAVIPTARQVQAAVFAAPLSVRGADGGKLLEPFIRDWSQGEVRRVSGAIRQGFFEGQTSNQILQEVRGTRANRFRDGVLAVSNRGAQAIVRTGVQHVASIARQQTWDENSKVVTGVQWVSTLDSRTTQTCRSLDGRVFPRNEGPRPPIHVNCRSTTVAQLDGRFSFLKEDGTRASKLGPVDADETYYSWLKKQPAAFQNEAIGPTRARLLREGGITAERFSELNLGKNFEPLTLDEMRRMEPVAFEKAGL